VFERLRTRRSVRHPSVPHRSLTQARRRARGPRCHRHTGRRHRPAYEDKAARRGAGRDLFPARPLCRQARRSLDFQISCCSTLPRSSVVTPKTPSAAGRWARDRTACDRCNARTAAAAPTYWGGRRLFEVREGAMLIGSWDYPYVDRSTHCGLCHHRHGLGSPWVSIASRYVNGVYHAGCAGPFPTRAWFRRIRRAPLSRVGHISARHSGRRRVAAGCSNSVCAAGVRL